MNYGIFFGRKAEEVAIDLLGRWLVKSTHGEGIVAKITRIGAYEGGGSAHIRRGMAYSPGTVFLMPYRKSYIFNIATHRNGNSSCVDIRELRFNGDIIHGCRAVADFLDITRDLDEMVFGEELKIIGHPADKSKVKRTDGSAKHCLGYFSI